jgi:hypothetical protein
MRADGIVAIEPVFSRRGRLEIPSKPHRTSVVRRGTLFAGSFIATRRRTLARRKWPVQTKAPFERIILMNDRLNDLDEMAEENRAYEVSDEMLGSAAGMEMGKPKAYTASFCSGLSVCPG